MNDLIWSDFKAALASRTMSLQYVETNSYYFLKAYDGVFEIGCGIAKDNGPDHVEFENVYKSTGNQPFISKTEGRFERDDIVLKLAMATGQADSNGDLTISFQLPGPRYLAGGYAFTDNYSWGDRVTKVEITDDDNLMGMGVGAVMKEYYDSEAPEANQGWPFWKTFGTEGECEIEPMGWYGYVPAPFYLKITMKIAPLANVKIALWQGKVE